MSEIISDKGVEWLHNEIETLRDENKALKEAIVVFNECYNNLKQSRDELLEAYKEHRWDMNMCRLGVKEELIQRAEGLKGERKQ